MAKTQRKAKTPSRRKPPAAVATRMRAGRAAAPPPQARGKLERVRMPGAHNARASMPASDDANEGKYV